MNIAITIITVTALLIMAFIVYKLLDTLKELAKLLKSDNLQEYITLDNSKKEKQEKKDIQVGQDTRYVDVDGLSQEEFDKIDINGYRNLGGDIKTEEFN